MPALLISEEQVAKTWDRVTALEEADALRLQRGAGPFQPEVTAFVLAYTSKLEPDAAALTHYVMLILFEVFREHAGRVRRAPESAVIGSWKRMRARIDELSALADAGESVRNMIVSGPQPRIAVAILEALADAGDAPDEPVRLQGDDFWQVYAVLLTVVEVLHEHAV